MNLVLVDVLELSEWALKCSRALITHQNTMVKHSPNEYRRFTHALTVFQAPVTRPHRVSRPGNPCTHLHEPSQHPLYPNISPSCQVSRLFRENQAEIRAHRQTLSTGGTSGPRCTFTYSLYRHSRTTGSAFHRVHISRHNTVCLFL